MSRYGRWCASREPLHSRAPVSKKRPLPSAASFISAGPKPPPITGFRLAPNSSSLYLQIFRRHLAAVFLLFVAHLGALIEVA